MQNFKHWFCIIFLLLLSSFLSFSQQPNLEPGTIAVDPIIATIPNQQQNAKIPQQQQTQTQTAQPSQTSTTQASSTGSQSIVNSNIAPTATQPIIVQPTNAASTGVPVNDPQIVIPSASTSQSVNQNTNVGKEDSPQINSNIGGQQKPVQNQGQDNNYRSENYDEPNAERSARYRAEQQRLNQIRRKQQRQFQQMKQLERQQEQVKQSKTQEVRNRQYNEIRSVQVEEPIGVTKKTVLFEVDYKIQQLILQPVTDVDIFIKMTVYVLQNNAYGLVKDVTTSGAVKIYIYEDHARIVAQGSFFFEKALKFKGKAKSTYTLRFYNEGVNKLISLTYPNLLQSNHIANLYSNEKRHLHLWKTELLGMRIVEVTERLRRNSMMDKVNNKTMMEFLKRYSGYQFFEMLAVLAVTGFQVHLIKKMFTTDSIV